LLLARPEPIRREIHDLTGTASAFTPDYAPEEMFEVATKLYEMSR
jgi:Mn-containing catalase